MLVIGNLEEVLLWVQWFGIHLGKLLEIKFCCFCFGFLDLFMLFLFVMRFIHISIPTPLLSSLSRCPKLHLSFHMASTITLQLSLNSFIRQHYRIRIILLSVSHSCLSVHHNLIRLPLTIILSEKLSWMLCGF